MSQQDPEAQPLTAEDFEFEQSSSFQDTSRPVPSRSPYHLPASEQLQGVANRIIFSRYYILFYGAMMGLSLATLVLSLVATRTFYHFVNNCENRMASNLVVAVDKGECPPIAWHIIEFVLNALMVLEVTTRWIANGRVCAFFVPPPAQFPFSPFSKNKSTETDLVHVEIPYDPSQHHRPHPRLLLRPHPPPRLFQPLRLRYEERRTARHYPHRRP